MAIRNWRKRMDNERTVAGPRHGAIDTQNQRFSGPRKERGLGQTTLDKLADLLAKSISLDNDGTLHYQ
jgi:hypothetical protein